MTSRRSRRGSGLPGGREVGCEGVQTRVGDRLYEGARGRQDGADGFRVVRDRCLFFLSPWLALALLWSSAVGCGQAAPAIELREVAHTTTLGGEVRRITLAPDDKQFLTVGNRGEIAGTAPTSGNGQSHCTARARSRSASSGCTTRGTMARSGKVSGLQRCRGYRPAEPCAR